MATLVKPNQSRSFRYLYTRIAAVLTFAALVIASPQIKELFETLPSPLPERNNPAKSLNNEVIPMNEYSTSRAGVTLSEVVLAGKTIFTIEDTTNSFRRELTEAQFENVQKDLNAIADPKEIKHGELNLTTEQENIFESIMFEPIDCTIQTDSVKKEEVTLYFQDELNTENTWSIEIGQEPIPVKAQLESFEETLTMPLNQFPELSTLSLDSCEG